MAGKKPSRNKPMHLSEQLRQYNKWRRGDDRVKAPCPKELGELIDSAADRLDVLEHEHALFFDNWHEERRRREKLLCAVQHCYEMLLAERDKNAALFQAEDILRGAMADQKHDTAKQQTPWIDPNNKAQVKFLPHIGEKCIFAHKGKTYAGHHTGGSFKTGNGVTAKHFDTWDCLWMPWPEAPLSTNHQA